MVPGDRGLIFRQLFENLVFLLPEKGTLEAGMDFADNLYRSVRTAGLRLSLKDKDRFWELIDGYAG